MAGRRPGAFLPRGPDRLRRAARGRLHAIVVLHPAPHRDAARGRAHARAGGPPRGGGDAPHGRRLRRQGVAVGAVRLRGGAGGVEVSPPGQAAPRPRRRHADHRQAPRLPLRLRGRLRRRRPRARAAHRDGRARRLLRRPVGPRRHARGVPCGQRLLPVGRRHPRSARAHEHAVQHGVSRLRRAAGRDRHRARARQHRPPARPRPARRAQAQLLRRPRPRHHALRPGGR